MTTFTKIMDEKVPSRAELIVAECVKVRVEPRARRTSALQPVRKEKNAFLLARDAARVTH